MIRVESYKLRDDLTMECCVCHVISDLIPDCYLQPWDDCRGGHQCSVAATQRGRPPYIIEINPV